MNSGLTLAASGCAIRIQTTTHPVYNILHVAPHGAMEPSRTKNPSRQETPQNAVLGVLSHKTHSVRLPRVLPCLRSPQRPNALGYTSQRQEQCTTVHSATCAATSVPQVQGVGLATHHDGETRRTASCRIGLIGLP
eukprot:scaffold168665_cov32-Tisochrysis_lutea.AAC.4